MHTCTHVEPDPQFVIAIRITEETYHLYEALPVATRLDLTALKNSFLVIPLSGVSWGLWGPRDFRKTYEHFELQEKYRSDKFTMYSLIQK